MGRIRTLKPEFGHNEDLSELPAEAHLVAALLLTYADDEGYFNANPRLVQAATCPLRTLSTPIPEILRRLHEISFIQLFKGSDGKPYGKISKFLSHQRISHPTPSKIAPLHTSSGNIPEDSAKPPEPLRPEGKGKEVERKGREGEETPPDFHPIQYAAKICQELVIPLEGNQRPIAGAIEALEKSGRTRVESFKFLMGRIRDALANGETVNVFWFRDGKYNSSRQGNDDYKTAAERRNERAKLALDRAWGEEESPGDMPADLQQGTQRGRGSSLA